MRFYTIEHGARLSNIGLVAPNDDELLVGVTSADGVVTGIPLSPFMVAGARQLGMTHLVEGTVATTPKGPSISTFKRRDGNMIREPDAPCIVLAKTTGKLTSSMFVDVVELDRVVRQYLGAGDMVGVTVLAQSSEQFLLEMLPKASFRIEAEAGTITVRWPGWDTPPPVLHGKNAHEAAELWHRYETRRNGLQVRTIEERHEGEQAVG